LEDPEDFRGCPRRKSRTAVSNFTDYESANVEKEWRLTISALVKPRTHSRAQVPKVVGFLRQPSTQVTAATTAGLRRQVGSTARVSRGAARAPAPNKARPATRLRRETMLFNETGENGKIESFG
jgi:hypothetical protein